VSPESVLFSEEGVDQWGERGSFSQYEDKTQQDQQDQQGTDPPFFVFEDELKQFLENF
jgi:hypothetical protein